ncbi:Lipoprotein signal peptidase [Nocardioides aquaticus]|uniref:Lipoprotein signal peptidase n=1 Tax=Nocardioides aquaticus TaxID=160826 RepID=A0ABX8ELP1_9ACTN|nr:Lipoprotein signal peptidase [Nocardioides aquaticus]
MQAARGTSLSDEQGSPGPVSPSVPSRRRRVASVVLLVTLATTWYAADQVTKALAVARLADGDVSVVDGVLNLTLVRNPGAAFSTGTEYTVALSCFAILATLVVLWVSRRVGSLVWATALGLLLAGVVGNLTDRLLREPSPLRGHVIDFLQLPSWPVFNLADIAINVAAGLILVQAFRNVRVDGEPVDAGDRDGTA